MVSLIVVVVAVFIVWRVIKSRPASKPKSKGSSRRNEGEK